MFDGRQNNIASSHLSHKPLYLNVGDRFPILELVAMERLSASDSVDRNCDMFDVRQDSFLGR